MGFINPGSTLQEMDPNDMKIPILKTVGTWIPSGLEGRRLNSQTKTGNAWMYLLGVRGFTIGYPINPKCR